METLSVKEISDITLAKKVDKKYEVNIYQNTKLFFTTILKDLNFSHYLDYTNEARDELSIYFFLYFKGEKYKSILNELNAGLRYFVLKVRKKI